MRATSLKALYFGKKPLFAVRHQPQRLRARSAAVLLCNPLGEEAARAHRIYRVLASQLERAGYAVLRFDYSGTGDSGGEGDSVTLGDWLDDVESAAEELRAATKARRIVAIGLRLGATLAALATARRNLRLRHLLMWDPVVDGERHLRELAEMHRSYLRAELGRAYRDRLPLSPAGHPREALGTPIPAALAAELAALDLSNEGIRAEHLTVIDTMASPGSDRLRARLEPQSTARWIPMDAGAAWNSDAALNATTVPMDVVQTLLARVEELSP